jgi:uncharacterized protein (UPF0332 family)
MTRFARALVRKSERALRSARLDLKDGDYDSAVNRSYYAMFDIARAALLRAGVAEDKLPRTHNGVIAAFGQHAVQTGQIDRELAADLSRTESHRIKADYTGIEIEPKIAAETVAKAEVFVQTVERVFALDQPSLAAENKNRDPSRDDKISEPVGIDSKIESQDALEEIRRQARENWLRLRQENTEGTQGVDRRKDTGRDAGEDRSRSLDDDLDEQGDA